MEDQKIKNFIIKSRQQGVPDDQILAFVKSKQAPVQSQTDTGIGQNIVSDVKQRGQNISDINTMRGQGQSVVGEVLSTVAPKLSDRLAPLLKRGQQVKQLVSNPSNDIATTGQLAGGVNDVIGEVIGAIIPEKWKQLGGEKVKQLLGTAGIDTIEKYNDWATKNPLTAKNIEGAVNIAGLLPTGKAGEVVGTAAVDTLKSGGTKLVGAVDDIGGGGMKLAGAIVPKPEDIMNRVARLTPTDARKFEAAAGKSHGQYLKETGNFGTPDEIVKKEAEKFVQSINEADNALASLPGEYKSPSIDIAAAELVDKAKRVSAPGIDSPILARSIELQNKANTTGLTMSEVNELKRMYERNVKLGYNKLMNADAVERATNIDNALRNWQFKQAKELGFTNLDELNKQTQLSKFMVDKLGNQILGKSGNNAVGLTDWIMVSGGDPTAIGGLLVKKFFSSEKVQSKIAQMLTKEAPQAVKTATINKPSTSIGLGSGEVTLSKPSQQLLEGKQLKKASTTVSKKNGIMSSDLSTEAKKYKSAEEFEQAVKKRASTAFELQGESIKEISIIGSTANGKLNPNDLDILITPTKKRLPTTSENIHTRKEFNDIVKREIEDLFPGKKVHVTVSEYDIARGRKMSLKELWNKANKK